jgi:hypothetical protein
MARHAASHTRRTALRTPYALQDYFAERQAAQARQAKREANAAARAAAAAAAGEEAAIEWVDNAEVQVKLQPSRHFCFRGYQSVAGRVTCRRCRAIVLSGATWGCCGQLLLQVG